MGIIDELIINNETFRLEDDLMNAYFNNIIPEWNESKKAFIHLKKTILDVDISFEEKVIIFSQKLN